MQKPLSVFENGTQHPVSQSSLTLQRGRHPAKSGTSDSTQVPRQQLLGMVSLPSHASPAFLQGVSQASSSAQISLPVSRRSVQQPDSQSASVAQGSSHTWESLPVSTQSSPSQQLLLAQLLPCPTQSPASAEGLAQSGVVAPASPVQKHDASSKVMQVYAAQ